MPNQITWQCSQRSRQHAGGGLPYVCIRVVNACCMLYLVYVEAKRTPTFTLFLCTSDADAGNREYPKSKGYNCCCCTAVYHTCCGRRKRSLNWRLTAGLKTEADRSPSFLFGEHLRYFGKQLQPSSWVPTLNAKIANTQCTGSAPTAHQSYDQPWPQERQRTSSAAATLAAVPAIPDTPAFPCTAAVQRF